MQLLSTCIVKIQSKSTRKYFRYSTIILWRNCKKNKTAIFTKNDLTVTQQDIKCAHIKKQNKLTWFDNTIALLTYTSWNTTRKYFLCKQIKKIKLENIQIPTFLIIYNSESLLVTSVHQVSNMQYIHVLKINNHSRSELYAHHDIVYALIQCIFKISDIPPFGVMWDTILHKKC